MRGPNALLQAVCGVVRSRLKLDAKGPLHFCAFAYPGLDPPPIFELLRESWWNCIELVQRVAWSPTSWNSLRIHDMLAVFITPRTPSVAERSRWLPTRVCKNIRAFSVKPGESLVRILTIVDGDSPNIRQHRPVSHESHGIFHEVETVVPANYLQSLVH